MTKQTFFIAGTDTDIGKTWVAVALLQAAKRQGLRTLGIKPLAAGADATPQGLHNEDALALMDAASLDLPYEQVNPVVLKAAASPHIAAALESRHVAIDRLAGFCRGAMSQPYDLALIEGAGGWRVPVNPRELLSELPKQLQLPVILVVGMRLGCLNHALLTAQAIHMDGLQLAGWVANTVDPNMPYCNENIATLKAALGAPCLGEIPFLNPNESASAADFLKIDSLLKY